MKKRRVKNPELPHEVEIEILAKLPVKALLRFKVVCSAWRDVIESSQFQKMHLSNKNAEKVLMQDFSSKSATFYVDGTRVEFPMLGPKFHVYPSNGVLLVAVDSDIRGEMMLWNPSTGKSREIPRPPWYDLPAHFHGFYYDPASGGFTVVMVGYCGQNVNVFESGSDTWKSIDIPAKFRRPAFISTPQNQLYSKAFVHGCFHLIDSGRIWSFSREGKIVNDFAPPPSISKVELNSFATVAFGGRLCLKGVRHIDALDFWEMEKYGDDSSWKHLFEVILEIPQPRSRSRSPLSPLQNGFGVSVDPGKCDFNKLDGYTPLYLLENGGRILVRNNKTSLYVQDLNTNVMTRISSLPDYRNWLKIAIEPYTESLFTP